jgi:AraC family transcriptional regulator
MMIAMRDEVRDGCPSGRLYGESLSLALLSYLGGRYADFGSEKSSRIGFSSDQMREILDYIGSNLTRDVSVTDLASLVQTSPSHFAHVFKLSFGVSPYHFIQQKRIEAAKRLLANSRLSSSQVALTYNFASQSHFAKVFRQFTGVTPKQYRAGL